MMDLDEALALNGRRVDDFIARAATLGAAWTTPVRPGKWSPAELAQHIALSYREAGRAFQGEGDAFPKLPFFLRPLLRRFVFDKVLKTGGDFGRPVKTFRKLTPAIADAPRSPDEGAARIRASLEAFEKIVRDLSGSAVLHPAFGTLRAADYVIFQAYHTTHHQKQLTAG